LAQRLLNCHRSVTIWGENGGIVSDLRSMCERYSESPVGVVDIGKFREFNEFADTFSPWANPFDNVELVRQCARLLDALYADRSKPENFWGFKEIRNNSTEDIDFLYELFPRCRVLSLVRHPKDVLVSQYRARWGHKYFAEEPEKVVYKLLMSYVSKVSVLLHAAEKRPSLTSVLRFESFCSESGALNLFEVLSLACAEVDRHLLRVVLENRVGSSFGDVARPVDRDYEQEIYEAYDRLIEPTLSRIAPPKVVNTIEDWYPDLYSCSQ